MAYATQSIPQNSGLAQRLADVAVKFAETRAKRRVYRETVRELGALTSRELADLGLHRSMIKGVAREAAYGK